jgi:hypothetical protein
MTHFFCVIGSIGMPSIIVMPVWFYFLKPIPVSLFLDSGIRFAQPE